MNRAFNIGKVFGIQIRLHYTWFIIFILITVSLSWQVFPHDYPRWPPLLYWITAVATSLLFFASVVAHELAHSLVGRANGIPIKNITLFIFGGVAQMTREAAHPGAEFKMAVAGPLCSLVLGGLFALLYFLAPARVEPVAAVAFWLAYINVALAVFNLIPGFPLDGGRVFRSLMWRLSGNYQRSTLIATQVGRGVGYLFILGGMLIILFRPAGLGWFNGLWLAFIGWFLENTASASYRQAQRYAILQGLKVSQVVTTNYPVVPPEITVSRLVQEYIFSRGQSLFLVADDDGIKGVLTLEDIKSMPRQNWATQPVREIMTPVDKLKAVHPDQDAISALEQMEESAVGQVLVVSEGQIIGLVVRDNLMNLLRTRAELEK